tara:strand:- start:276 stop:653 length:378 start_codon:yes stop_codon:yes gene_type:complete
MEFTETHLQHYNGVTAQDLTDFNNRVIIYHSTQSSCLGSENAVLTLENESIFYTEMNKFFKRLKASKKINEYTEDRKCQFFYKWVQVFLSDYQAKNKAVNYIYSNTPFNELKEAAIILYFQEINN